MFVWALLPIAAVFIVLSRHIQEWTDSMRYDERHHSCLILSLPWCLAVHVLLVVAFGWFVVLTCVRDRDITDGPSIYINNVDASSIKTIVNIMSFPSLYHPPLYCLHVHVLLKGLSWMGMTFDMVAFDMVLLLQVSDMVLLLQLSGIVLLLWASNMVVLLATEML